MVDMIKYYATPGNGGTNYGRGATQTALQERGLLTALRSLTADGWREADSLVARVEAPAREVVPSASVAGRTGDGPSGQVNLAESAMKLAESTRRQLSRVAGSYGTSARPMTNRRRVDGYLAQTGRKTMTPKQARRANKRLDKALSTVI
jgi:hypothetical protein